METVRFSFMRMVLCGLRQDSKELTALLKSAASADVEYSKGLRKGEERYCFPIAKRCMIAGEQSFTTKYQSTLHARDWRLIAQPNRQDAWKGDTPQQVIRKGPFSYTGFTQWENLKKLSPRPHVTIGAIKGSEPYQVINFTRWEEIRRSSLSAKDGILPSFARLPL